MTDVFISYARVDRDLMALVKRRLDEQGLDLFVDVEGRLDGTSAFPDAIDAGVRAAKAVLGCWTPHALSREWVKIECGMAREAEKLVAVELEPLASADVPAMFYYAERKNLTDFRSDDPHEGWAMTLSALATKLRAWAERHPAAEESAAALAKAARLEAAAAEERQRAIAARPAGERRPPAVSASHEAPAGAASGAAASAWAAIASGADKDHYERFVRTFQNDPGAFAQLIEAEARLKLIADWEQVNQVNPFAIEAAIRESWFPGLVELARARAALVRDDKWVMAELKRMQGLPKATPPQPTDGQPAKKGGLFARLQSRSSQDRPPPPTELFVSHPLRIAQRIGEKEYAGIAGDVVVVPKGARVKGDVLGNRVRVYGRVEGMIRGVAVYLGAPAHVIGEIRHQSLSIEPNVVFEGAVQHTEAIWGA
ncbi:MAG: TIR domain-containing protein [Hyphomonadaceae bacterium]